MTLPDPGHWAVHSLYAAPVQVLSAEGDSFTYSISGVDMLRSGIGDVLAFLPAKDEARDWQQVEIALLQTKGTSHG